MSLYTIEVRQVGRYSSSPYQLVTDFEGLHKFVYILDDSDKVLEYKISSGTFQFTQTTFTVFCEKLVTKFDYTKDSLPIKNKNK